MDNDSIDPLQIKIEIARRKLPLETVNAIDTVDWRAAILELRNKRGFTFEQLGRLEIETELVLCGLLNPKDYLKEVEKRMEITRAQANEVVNEMNETVFKKIREELIKNTERKKIFANKGNTPLTKEVLATPVQSPYKTPTIIEIVIPPKINNNAQVFKSAGIEFLESVPELPNGNKPTENRQDILNKVENPDAVHPITMQKLSGATQTKVVETEHTLGNLSKPATNVNTAPKIDPYREIPQ